jgi:hypothetical protein
MPLHSFAMVEIRLGPKAAFWSRFNETVRPEIKDITLKESITLLQVF